MRFAMFFFIVLSLSVSHAVTIIVGAPIDSPPFIMLVDKQNHFIGFDADIMEEICRRLELKCQLKATEHQHELAALAAGTIDLAIGNLTITPEREEVFLPSLPYLASDVQFITMRDSDINAINDIRGKIVGVEKSSVIEQMVENKFGSSVTMKKYARSREILGALSNGNIDVGVLEQATAETWLANTSSMYKLVGKPIPIGLGYGIMATKNKAGLISRINKALLSMESDGTYLKIYSTYFGGGL